MNECEYAQSDVPVQYLTGTLTSQAVQVFEAHYFVCDRCWRELEVATVLRPRIIRRTRRFALPAAAAAIAVVMLSAYVVTQRARVDDPVVMRSPARAPLVLTAAREGNSVSLQWPAVPGAASYGMAVYDSEGTLLQQLSTTSPASTIALPAAPPRLFVRVDAVDPAGRQLATSSLQALPVAQ